MPTKQARLAAAAHTAGDVARATATYADPTVARAGTPAYLMLLDGLIQAAPRRKELLVAGCRAYTSYASMLREPDPERLSFLYARARDYGFRALSTKRDFRRAFSGELEEFALFLEDFDREDVPALFWTATAWAGWIQANPDEVEALAELPMLEATMRRLLHLDESFYYGGPHLLLASYLAARPAVLGGNLQEARKHFERAFALGADQTLMAKVLFAKYYALRTRDRALFETTLRQVLAAPADTVPELTLSNVLAKEQARELLEKVDVYFGEQP